MKKTGIIFDLDGTMWDSSREVAASWNEIIKKHRDIDLSLTGDDIRSVMGMTMYDIAEKLFFDLDENRRMELLLECEAYENVYIEEHGGKLFPKMEETLDTLSKDYPLFIMSNCQLGYIDAFLKYYDFEKYFADHMCFGDNKMPKDYNIREIAKRNGLGTYYYVGDLQADYDAAMKAGARFIHAAYGFGTINEDVPFVQSISKLPKLMNELTKNDGK